MLGRQQGFFQCSIFRTEVIIALLRTRQFRLQSKEFSHDRFPISLGRLELFFEQKFHVVKDISRALLLEAHEPELSTAV